MRILIIPGECTRHHHGRGAGVCHTAQYDWQTALRPGNLFWPCIFSKSYICFYLTLDISFRDCKNTKSMVKDLYLGFEGHQSDCWFVRCCCDCWHVKCCFSIVFFSIDCWLLWSKSVLAGCENHRSSWNLVFRITICWHKRLQYLAQTEQKGNLLMLLLLLFSSKTCMCASRTIQLCVALVCLALYFINLYVAAI